MDRYEIVHRLGLGGCGAVYLARNKDSKRLVALKKIELDERKKTRTKEAVQKEASILSQLKHPHIVSYHESFFDEDEEFLYIVQDFCDAGTLEDKIRESSNKGKHFEEKDIMCWFIQLTMAVQHMHSNKILHRDLKTENVFMTKKNVVKIGDFGISKVLDSTIDMAKTVVGTPTYLSPELCQDIPYSSKSDIWALGCVLYEMCALKPPFDAQNLVSLFFKIIKAEYEPIPDQYSTSLNDLVNSLLVKTPDDRPSASAILNMPFVKKHLAAFIEEKEILLHLKIKDSSNRSSPHFNQSDSNNKSKNLPNSGNTSLNQQGASPKIQKKNGVVHGKQERSPHQIDSGLAMSEATSDKKGDLSDYSDDFDDSSDLDEDIPEDIPIVIEGEEDEGGDNDYADDFEDYDSSEDLDELVTQAKEAVEIEVVDDYIVDEKLFDHHKQHTGFFKRQCIEALGGRKISEVNKLILNGTLTEEDLKPQIRRTIHNDETAEICHFDIDELPTG